jgi:hypothetical protein
MKGSLDSLGSAIESVKISITELQGGPLKKIVDDMTKWVRANEGLIASNIADWINKLIAAGRFLGKHGDKIVKAAAAYAALAVAVKAIALAITAVDLALKAGAMGNIIAFFVLWGVALGTGLNKIKEGVEAAKAIKAAMDNYGKVTAPGGGATAAWPTVAPSTAATTGPFNNKLKIAFEDLPKGATVEGDLDSSVELNTGNSGEIN